MDGYDRFGTCPGPFLEESYFPKIGGNIEARDCVPNPTESTHFGGNASYCCIPCPVYDYLYPSNFDKLIDGTAWVQVAGFALCSFLLLSMLVLPTEATRRSFLNVSLLIGVMFIQLGFIVPLARRPSQCFDAITPADMHSDTTCAFSGAFIVFGLVTCAAWIMVRALYMFMIICLDIKPGKRLDVGANIMAWVLVAVFTSAAMAYNGVGFRFGGYCYLNSHGSLMTYWGFLFGMDGIAFVLQFAIFIYLARVYLKLVILHTPGSHSSSSHSQKRPNSIDSRGAAAQNLQANNKRSSGEAMRARVAQALAIQWRSLAIITFSVVTTAFVCASFVTEDTKRTATHQDPELLMPWALCIIERFNSTTSSGIDCSARNLTKNIIISDKLVYATLFLLAFYGIEVFLLLFKTEILPAWWELLRELFGIKKGVEESRREQEEEDIDVRNFIKGVYGYYAEKPVFGYVERGSGGANTVHVPPGTAF